MISNKYQNNTGLVSTSIAGGRPHHCYRQPVQFTEEYDYELSYGENFHSLSAIIFGSDEYYWILMDNNKPKDVFDLGVYARVKLPKALAKGTDANKRIF